MDPSQDILDPDQPVALSTGQTITVRELTWKEAKRFLTGLAERAAEFVAVGPGGAAQVNTERLLAVLTTDLGEQLVAATTGLDAAALEALRVADFTRLLERAVSLNLRPEMIAAGKAVAGRFTALSAARGR